MSSTAIIAVLAAASGPATAQVIIIDEDTTLSPEGNPYAGIQIRDGASLTGAGLIINQSDNDRGVQVIDGSTDLSGGEITQSGTTSYVLGIELLGGTAQVSHMKITVSGTTSAAGFFTNGNDVELIADGVEISVEASGATNGTPAAGGISRSGIIRTSNSTIAVQGDTVYGLLASGAGSQVFSSNDTITTSGERGWGAFAWSGTRGTGTIEIDGGSITTGGTYAHGLLAQEAGSRVATANGLAVTTQGTQAMGAYAIDGSLDLSDTTITTNGEGAAGIYVNGGEAVIGGGSVTTHGPASAAVRIYDSGTFTASNTELTTDDGPGIHVTNSGTVAVTSSTIRSNASSLAASFTETGLIEFILGDGAVATENDGRLLAVSRSGEGSEGQVLLFLEEGSVTSGDIVDEDPVTGSGGTDVILAEGASWTGMLRDVHNFTSSSGSLAFVDGIDITGDLFANGTGFSFSDLGGTIGGNVILGGGSTTTGATIVSPIAVGGNVDIDQESVLGGNWAISGNLTNSGRVTPGNPIGRISVDGDLTLLPDSILDMEIGPEDADLIEVRGTANLDGSVQVTPLAGVLLNTPYTIVDAAGGISGTFAGGVAFVEPLPFVDSILGYEPSSALVTFARNDVAFASVAGTSNQRRVAEALDEIASPDPLASAIIFTSKSGARQAFDRLSGEIHASTMAALVEDSDHLRDAAINRLRAASGSINAGDMPIVAFAPRGGEGDAVSAREGVTIWGGGFGSWTDLDGSDGVSDISTTTGGFVLGADTATGNWRLGLMAGFSETDIDGPTASASSSNFHLGAYAGTEWGALAFRAGLAHSWHDVDLDRSVVAGTLSERLESDYGAETFQAFAEFGYRIDGERAAFEPFVNLAYVDFESDGYSEGAGAAALAGSGGAMEATLTTLGLRASTEVDLGGLNEAVLSGMVGWRHAFGDIGSALNHAFPAGDSFRVRGAAIAEDALLLEAGLRYDLGETARFGIATNGQFGSSVAEFGLAAQIGIRF